METKKFKTRTIFMERTNGSLPGMWPCAIDVGYSSVKVFSPNMIACFPSFAKPIDNDVKAVGKFPDEHIIYHDLETDRKWLVGDAAHRDMNQDDTTVSEESVFGRKRYDDPMFLILVRTGLALGCMDNSAGVLSGRAIHVQTGLPPKYLKQDSKYMIGAIAGKHVFGLKIGNNEEKRIELEIKREHVDVMEQPMGTLMSVSIDAQHRMIKEARNYFNSNVLVFDAGFGTLDIFPIINNMVKEKQTFPAFGMRQVLKKTIDAIYEAYGEEVSMIGMQKCLDTGAVRCSDNFSSEDRPFDAMLEKASHDVCDEALNKIGSIFKLSEFDYFIVTGGAGAAWNDPIHEKLKGLHALQIVNGNQNDTSLPFLFANVRGYFMYRYGKMEALIRKQRRGD